MLLAGEGTRMHPLTYTKPKPLLKVAGQTILEHNLENLKKSGIQDVTLVVGYLQEEIKKLLENHEFNFNFVSQSEQLGTGHALLQVKDSIKDESFIVIYGDDFYHHEDIKKALANELCVTAKEVSNPEKFGVFTLENGFINDLIEKPTEPVSNLANTGLYVLSKDVFESLQTLKKSQRNEFELTDAILHLSKENSIKCEITNNWIPIGYPWDLVAANEIKMQELGSSNIHNTAFVDKNVTMEGSVTIGRNSKIKNGAYIEGPVMIGDNCVIGPNCYLRPNSVIGNNCRIGNGTEIKNTLVGDRTNIEHLTYVGDSIIGDNCNLGAGTIVSNLRHDNKTIRVMVKGDKVDTGRRKFGVVMGDYTKTGVNTAIYPGVMMGPFSWTSPATAVKENITPLTLDGNKVLNETKFDAELVKKIKFVQSRL